MLTKAGVKLNGNSKLVLPREKRFNARQGWLVPIASTVRRPARTHRFSNREYCDKGKKGRGGGEGGEDLPRLLVGRACPLRAAGARVLMRTSQRAVGASSSFFAAGNLLVLDFAFVSMHDSALITDDIQ